VTGGASGIGRATARAFAAEGTSVVVADRQQDLGEETVAELRGLGVAAEFVVTDITDDVDAAAMVAAAISSFGRLDVAVNCAGVDGGAAPTHEYDEGEFDRVVAINLKGIWLSLKHEAPAMFERGGAIVNISSGAALVGVPTMPAYVASKAGVIGLTKTTALEYAGQGIRVNAICPGVTETPMVEKLFTEVAEAAMQAAEMTPMKRLARPEEIAACAVYLCSDGASYITGTAIPVDGGLRAQ
jgi:NAD(P)-dependent dehydrogenase (short-subunit alcohol dehydrogenase family)